MDPITVAVGAAAGVVRFVYANWDKVVIAGMTLQSAIKNKLRDMKERDFNLAAGVLSNEEGSTVNALIEAWMREPIDLRFNDLSGHSDFFLHDIFRSLAPACGLIKISAKGIPLIGGGVQIGYQVAEFNNPLAKLQNEHNDLYLFREEMQEPINTYLKDHNTSVSKALVIVLMNYIQLFLALIDQAKNYPGKENTNALEVLRGNLINLVENFKRGPAEERTLSFLNFFSVTATGRSRLCDAIMPKIDRIIDTAIKEQKERSLQITAKNLETHATLALSKIKKFTQSHYKKIIDKQNLGILDTRAAKSSMKALLIEWDKVISSHATSFIESERIFLQSEDGKNTTVAAANHAIQFFYIAMLFSSKVKKTLEKNGHDLQNPVLRNEVNLLLIFIKVFQQYSAKQFDNLIPSSEKKQVHHPQLMHIKTQKFAVTLDIKKELTDIDGELNQLAKATDEILNNIPSSENPVADVHFTARIAVICVFYAALKDFTATLLKCDRPITKIAVDQISLQIKAFSELQKIASPITVKKKYGEKIFSRLTTKCIIVGDKLFLNLIRTEKDFEDVILLLNESAKEENKSILTKIENAKAAIFLEQKQQQLSAQAPAQALAQETPVNIFSPVPMHFATPAKRMSANDAESSIVNFRVLDEFHQKIQKLIGRYTQHSGAKDRSYFYECNNADTSKNTESLKDKGIIYFKTSESFYKINLTQLKNREDFENLIAHLAWSDPLVATVKEQTQQLKNSTVPQDFVESFSPKSKKAQELKEINEQNKKFVVMLEAYKRKLFAINDVENKAIYVFNQLYSKKALTDIKTLSDIDVRLTNDQEARDCFNNILAALTIGLAPSGEKKPNPEKIQEEIDRTDTLLKDLFSEWSLTGDELKGEMGRIVFNLIDKGVINISISNNAWQVRINFDNVERYSVSHALSVFLREKSDSSFSSPALKRYSDAHDKLVRVLNSSSLSDADNELLRDAKKLFDSIIEIANRVGRDAARLTSPDIEAITKFNTEFDDIGRKNILALAEKLSPNEVSSIRDKLKLAAVNAPALADMNKKHQEDLTSFENFKHNVCDFLKAVLEERKKTQAAKRKANPFYRFFFSADDQKSKILNEALSRISNSSSREGLEFNYGKFLKCARKRRISIRSDNKTRTVVTLLDKLERDTEIQYEIRSLLWKQIPKLGKGPVPTPLPTPLPSPIVQL